MAAGCWRHIRSTNSRAGPDAGPAQRAQRGAEGPGPRAAQPAGRVEGCGPAAGPPRGPARGQRARTDRTDRLGDRAPQRPARPAAVAGPGRTPRRTEHPCRAGTRAAPGRERGRLGSTPAARLRPQHSRIPWRRRPSYPGGVEPGAKRNPAGAGSITLRTRVEHGARIAEQLHTLALRLEIADDGRGVPEELAEHLFLPW